MTVRRAQKLRNILIVTGLVIMLAGYYWETLLTVGAIVSFSCLIPHFLYNKCPRCGKQLGRNEEKFCQHCGTKIDG